MAGPTYDDSDPAQAVQVPGQSMFIPPWLVSGSMPSITQPIEAPIATSTPDQLSLNNLDQYKKQESTVPKSTIDLANGKLSQSNKLVQKNLTNQQKLDNSEKTINEGIGQQIASINDASAADQQRGDIEAGMAAEKAKSLAESNENLYGKVDPETGQRDNSGLINERERLNKEYASGLAQAVEQKKKDSDAYANYKIDPNRRWNDLGTGSKIGLYVSMALSGIGDALMHRGGPNLVSKMIDDAIQQDISMQKDERDRLGKVVELRGNELADLRQKYGDDLTAKNMKIATEYKRVADQIDLQASKYGSDLAKNNAAKMSAEYRAKAGLLEEQAGAREHQRIWEQEKERQSNIRHQQSIGVQYAQLKQSASQFDRTLAQQKDFHDKQYDLEIAKLAAAGQAKKAEDLKKEKEDIRERGVFIPSNKITKDAEGKITPQWDNLKMKDGSTYLMPEKSVEKGQDIYDATMKVVQTVDDIRLLRREQGGLDQAANSLYKTEHGRRIAQEQARAIIAMHQASGINRFSDEVVHLAERMLTGDVDPSGMKTVMGALEVARKDVVSDFNAWLHTHRYDGEDISFADPINASSPDESEQSKLRGRFEKSGGTYGGFSEFTGERAESLNSSIKDLLNLQNDLYSKDKDKSSSARKELEYVTTSGPSGPIQDQAKDLLSRWKIGVAPLLSDKDLNKYKNFFGN